MKANELRIGNWAFNPHEKRNFKISVFDIQFLDDGGDSESIKPIQLTPEILEKAGGIISSGVNWLFYNFRDYDLKVGLTGNAFVFRYDEEAVPFPCKYLHQLQNLYFALTGEELNIDL